MNTYNTAARIVRCDHRIKQFARGVERLAEGSLTSNLRRRREGQRDLPGPYSNNGLPDSTVAFGESKAGCRRNHPKFSDTKLGFSGYSHRSGVPNGNPGVESHGRTTRRKKVTMLGRSFVLLVCLWNGIALGQVHVRRDIVQLDPNGPEIAALRKGVAVMKSRPSTDPTSWAYQANIHATYDTPALALWNQCQHGTYYFFSWHRMYLYYFERILRAASQPFAPILELERCSRASTAASVSPTSGRVHEPPVRTQSYREYE